MPLSSPQRVCLSRTDLRSGLTGSATLPLVNHELVQQPFTNNPEGMTLSILSMQMDTTTPTGASESD